MNDLNDMPAVQPRDGWKLNEFETLRLKKAVDAVQDAWGNVWRWHATPESYQQSMMNFHAAMTALRGMTMEVGTFPRREDDKPCLRCGAAPHYINLNCTSCNLPG